jgi:hypothetical protein
VSETPLEEFLAIVRRDLGAEEARLLEAGESLPPSDPHLRCEIPGGRSVVARFAALPVDAAARQQRLAMLVSSFDEILAPPGDKQRASRPPPARSLHDELNALTLRAGAVDALVIDTRSPVVWGTVGEERDAPTLTLAPEIIPPSRPSGEVLREPGEESNVARLSRQYGLAAVEGLWMDPAATRLVPRALCDRYRLVPIARNGDTLVIGMANPEDLDAIHDLVLITGLDIDPVVAGASMLALYARWNPGNDASTVDELLAAIPADERPAREARAHAARDTWKRHLASRRAVAEVRALPQMATLHKGGHLHSSLSEPAFGYVAHSFAAIYVLLLVFDAAFDELRAKRALVQALPTIERLVLALPPLDPEPRLAGVVALRGRGRGRRR